MSTQIQFDPFNFALNAVLAIIMVIGLIMDRARRDR